MVSKALQFGLIFQLILIIYIEVCSSHPSNVFISKASGFIDALDSAKEAATSCRYLANFADNIQTFNLQDKQTLKLIVPKKVEECYLFIDRLIRTKMNQFGLGDLRQIVQTLARTSLTNDNAKPSSNSESLVASRLLPDYKNRIQYEDFTNHKANHMNRRANGPNRNDMAWFLDDMRKNEYRDRIAKEAMAKGADFCSFIRTGVLGNVFKFVDNYMFTTLSQFLPETSPMANLISLTRHKRNTPLYNLMIIGNKCKQYKLESHLESQPSKHLKIPSDQRLAPTHYLSVEYALDVLGQNPTCEKVNVFILMRAHSIKDELIITRLAEASRNLLRSCLDNLHQVKARFNIMQDQLTADQTIFTWNLISFLGNKFVTPLNSNIIDRSNPRNLLENTIEHDLFFQAAVQKSLHDEGLEPVKVYESGQGICHVIETYDFYSANVQNIALTGAMELLHILLSINDLEVDLMDQRIRFNQQLQSFLLWNMCKDLSSYRLNVGDIKPYNVTGSLNLIN